MGICEDMERIGKINLDSYKKAILDAYIEGKAQATKRECYLCDKKVECDVCCSCYNKATSQFYEQGEKETLKRVEDIIGEINWDEKHKCKIFGEDTIREFKQKLKAK
jgi:hypothetical protein